MEPLLEQRFKVSETDVNELRGNSLFSRGRDLPQLKQPCQATLNKKSPVLFSAAIISLLNKRRRNIRTPPCEEDSESIEVTAISQ